MILRDEGVKGGAVLSLAGTVVDIILHIARVSGFLR